MLDEEMEPHGNCQNSAALGHDQPLWLPLVDQLLSSTALESLSLMVGGGCRTVRFFSIQKYQHGLINKINLNLNIEGRTFSPLKSL